MKRLLLIGLTSILGIGSLATNASADIFVYQAGDRGGYYRQESYHPAEKPQLSPISKPLKYRVEHRPETVEPEIYQDHRQVDRYIPQEDYYRQHRRRFRFRPHHHGTRNDPGRY
jgi:hypothetical protein